MTFHSRMGKRSATDDHEGDFTSLIDELPDAGLAVAARVLHALRATDDPVLGALLEAPLDEEPASAEERHAVREAREELARGGVHRLEGVRREFGL